MPEQPPEDSIFFVVPESERNPMRDIADEYAIQMDSDANAGCIIWGKYGRIAARVGRAGVFDEDHASENSTDAQNTESED